VHFALEAAQAALLADKWKLSSCVRYIEVAAAIAAAVVANMASETDGLCAPIHVRQGVCTTPMNGILK